MIVILLRLTLVGGYHPADPDAIVKVVETLAFVDIAFDLRLSVFVVKHPEVKVPERFGAGVGDLEGDGEVVDPVVAHDQITGLAMQCEAATHAVVTILVVVHQGIGRVLRFNLVINADAVAEVADTCLNKETAVGVGLEREQLADLGLEMESSLEHSQRCNHSAAANDLALVGGDTLTKDVDAVALHLVAKDEVAIGRKQPVALGLVDDTPSDGIGEAKVGLGVHPWKLGGISHLKHGGGDGLLVDVSRCLGKA